MKRVWRWLMCKKLGRHAFQPLETLQFGMEFLTLERCRRCGRRQVSQLLAVVGITTYHSNLRPYYAVRKAMEDRVREEQS